MRSIMQPGSFDAEWWEKVASLAVTCVALLSTIAVYIRGIREPYRKAREKEETERVEKAVAKVLDEKYPDMADALDCVFTITALSEHVEAIDENLGAVVFMVMSVSAEHDDMPDAERSKVRAMLHEYRGKVMANVEHRAEDRERERQQKQDPVRERKQRSGIERRRPERGGGRRDGDMQ